MKSNLSSAKIQQAGGLSPAVIGFTDCGQIGAAIDVLGHHWKGFAVDVGSDDPDVLLACATVMSIGGLRSQIAGTQEIAKNLYTKAMRLSTGYLHDLATVGLAYAYWRSGEQNNGLVAVNSLLNSDLPEIRFRAWFCQSVIQSDTDVLLSLQSLEVIAPLLDDVSLALKGKFHGQRAFDLKKLADATDDITLRDRAIIEYEAASVAFEEVGNLSREATVTNNLAGLYSVSGDYSRAHVNVDRAISLFTRLEDMGQLALSYDQKARIYLRETRFSDAEKMAERAVRILSRGDHASWLADCMETLNKAKDADTKRETTERDREREIIRHALEVTNGATSKAAYLLGLTQPGLAFKIDHQYPELKSLRKKPRLISFRPIRKSKKK